MITKKELKFMAIFIGLIVIFFGVYLFYLFSGKEGKGVVDQKIKNIEQPCSVLSPDGGETTGLTPFSPTLRSKISGDYNTNEAVCQWTINDVPIPDTYPVAGECVFGGRTFASQGDYKITLKIVGLSDCRRTVTIIGK